MKINSSPAVASIMTSSAFCSMVEQNVDNLNMSYIDAILLVCENTGLESDSVNKLLTPTIKKRVRVEASTLKLLKAKHRRF